MAGQLDAFVRDVRLWLEEFNVDALLGCYIGPTDRSHAIAFHANSVDPRRRSLLFFLFLSSEISLDDLRSFLSDEAISEALCMGYLEIVSAKARLPNHRLVFHNGVYIFCDSANALRYAYYGADSLALGRSLSRCQGAVLDVCSGVGTQGISLARAGCEVTCIDTCASCESLFSVNVCLNDVSDRAKFQCKDVAHASGSFDWIVCNPPLLPVPSGIEFPVAGNGGADGDFVILELLRHAPNLLSELGRVRFIGTILGDDDGPNIRALCEVSTESHLSLDILVLGQTPLEIGSPMFEGLVQTAVMSGTDELVARHQFQANLCASTRRRLYSIIGTARRSSDGSSCVNTSRHYAINRSFWSL